MHDRSINLLEGPILGTFVRFAAPFVLTSLLTTLYTLTDLFWIGRLGSDAVAAVGLIGFLTWLGDAIATGSRTGIGVVTAQTYGAGADPDRMTRVLSAGFQTALGFALAYGVLAQIIVRPFSNFYGLGSGVADLAVQYGRIVFLGMIFKMMHFSYAQAYQSFGESRAPFWINVVGLAVNVALDPLLIFGLGPIPALGVAGAAWATALAQMAVFYVFRWHARAIARGADPLTQPTSLIARIRFFRKSDAATARLVVKIGWPVMLLVGTFCIINLLLSRMSATFGPLAVAVETIGSQIESINWMTSDGFSSALTAMAAQNIGAGKKERAVRIMRTGIRLMVGVGLAVMLAFLFFGRQIFWLFMPEDPQAVLAGTWYLLIFSVSEPFMALETSTNACFNAFGRTGLPAANSVVFNALRIPLGLLLMGSMAYYGIWLGMSISSLFKGSIIYFLFCRLRREYLEGRWQTAGVAPERPENSSLKE